MPILLTDKMYSPALVGQNRDKMFVFGDNAERVGMGGQACIRKCGNVIGVATKISPTMEPTAFFDEENSLAGISLIALDLHEIAMSLKNGCTVVVPVDAVGNVSLGLGLAELDTRAPTIYAFIVDTISRLSKQYGIGSF